MRGPLPLDSNASIHKFKVTPKVCHSVPCRPEMPPIPPLCVFHCILQPHERNRRPTSASLAGLDIFRPRGAAFFVGGFTYHSNGITEDLQRYILDVVIYSYNQWHTRSKHPCSRSITACCIATCSITLGLFLWQMSFGETSISQLGCPFNFVPSQVCKIRSVHALMKVINTLEAYPQLTKMSFDEIFDLTAAAFYFVKIYQLPGIRYLAPGYRSSVISLGDDGSKKILRTSDPRVPTVRSNFRFFFSFLFSLHLLNHTFFPTFHRGKKQGVWVRVLLGAHRGARNDLERGSCFPG